MFRNARLFRFPLALVLTLVLAWSGPTGLLAKAREVKMADVEAIRLLGPNNLPVKVLVVLSYSSGNLKFVANLVKIVARIHEVDRIPAAEKFTVQVFAGHDDLLAELKKMVGAKIYDTYVEKGPAYVDGDIWMQDWGEIGMVKLRDDPKPQLLILDSNRGKASYMFMEGGTVPPLLAKVWNACYMKNPAPQVSGGDMGGNLEVTPDDILVVGNTITPQFRDFLGRRGYKDRMVELEADWLAVGHCDEFLSIVPNDRVPDGFTLVKGDPALAFKLILEADRAEIAAITAKEYREQLLFLWDYLHTPGENQKRWVAFLRAYQPDTGASPGNRPPRLTDKGPYETPEKFGKGSADLFIRQNLAIAAVIDQNIDRLTTRINAVNRRGDRALSLAAFPMLYGRKNSKFLGYLPGVINQLILRKHLVIADPKLKLFREAIRKEVEPLGLTPHFIDDTPYHTRWGDVHCATNVFRHPNRYIVRPRNLPAIWAPPAEKKQ
ncbi:MAG: hypothetical protein GX442_07465 [Candidatus Riflebacteria bacterium]|nr:hypothetical protein [Candidatus Riflebacteria bacterium]